MAYIEKKPEMHKSTKSPGLGAQVLTLRPGIFGRKAALLLKNAWKSFPNHNFRFSNLILNIKRKKPKKETTTMAA